MPRTRRKQQNQEEGPILLKMKGNNLRMPREIHPRKHAQIHAQIHAQTSAEVLDCHTEDQTVTIR